ncbi:MAG: AAA family ATPase [Promethearchaeota archaeon]|jgi:dephospho-CoA kinase
MKVIAICGLPGSGKTTAIEAVQDLGIVVTMGDVVRNEARKRNLEPTGYNIGKLAKELRKSDGSAIIAQKCVDLIKESKAQVFLVDGVRSLSEVNVFRRFWKFPVIAIIVREEDRFTRLLERNRIDDPKNFEELEERDQREIQFGLEEVLKNADYIIKNDSTIEQLRKNIRNLVSKVIETY